MKTLLVLAAAVLVLVPAAFATGQALDPRVPGLQKQVRNLTVQVNGLRSTVNQNADVLNHEIDLQICLNVYQSHFNYGVLDLFAILTGNGRITDATPGDGGACSRVGIAPPRRALSLQRSPFSTMLGLLTTVSHAPSR